jgi:hypothetical protein
MKSQESKCYSASIRIGETEVVHRTLSQARSRAGITSCGDRTGPGSESDHALATLHDSPVGDQASSALPSRRGRGRRWSRRAISVVTGMVALAVLSVSSAQAATVSSTGSPGSVYESSYYIHCNTGTYPSLSVDGVQTWASPAYGGSQRVGVIAYLYRWNSTTARWDSVGKQGLGTSWTRSGYGAVSFGYAFWDLTSVAYVAGGSSHGYFTAVLQVQWGDENGRLLGESLIRPSVRADFSASYAYAGNPGYCKV